MSYFKMTGKLQLRWYILSFPIDAVFLSKSPIFWFDVFKKMPWTQSTDHKTPSKQCKSTKYLEVNVVLFELTGRISLFFPPPSPLLVPQLLSSLWRPLWPCQSVSFIFGIYQQMGFGQIARGRHFSGHVTSLYFHGTLFDHDFKSFVRSFLSNEVLHWSQHVKGEPTW